MSEPLLLPTLDALRHHVLLALCRNDQLDPEQTPLQQSVIIRRGRPCGLFFQVHGPRMLKNYAIWSSDENRILYYNAVGERTTETRITSGPDARTLRPAA